MWSEGGHALSSGYGHLADLNPGNCARYAASAYIGQRAVYA